MIEYLIRKHPHISLLNLGAFLLAMGGHIAGCGLQIYPIAAGISMIVSAICLQAKEDPIFK